MIDTEYGYVFLDFENFRAFDEATWELHKCVESSIRNEQIIQGCCDVCENPQRFTVDSGAWFGDGPNLREGLVCQCGLSNRNRLILLLPVCEERVFY
jgi:hypothetical protein